MITAIEYLKLRGWKAHVNGPDRWQDPRNPEGYAVARYMDTDHAVRVQVDRDLQCLAFAQEYADKYGGPG